MKNNRLKIVVDYQSQGMNRHDELFFELTSADAFIQISEVLAKLLSNEVEARPKMSELERRLTQMKEAKDGKSQS